MTAKEYGDKIIDLEKRRNYRGAYEEVREALTIYPTNSFFLRSEVYILYRSGKIKEAREKAEQRMEVLKNDPFFLKTYLLILEKERAKGDIERIIEGNIFINKIGDEDFYIFLSKLAGRVFSREKALEIMERALLIFPESDPEISPEISHEIRKIKEILNEGGEKSGADGRYGYYRERFKGKRVNDVIAELERIRILPGYAGDYQLHLYLAELYRKVERYDRAIDTYRFLLSLKDDEFTRKMLGYTYYKTGDHESALVYLRDLFLKNPHDHYLYSTILKIFEERLDYEGFERLINEAMAINPDARHLHGLLKRAQRWKRRE